MKIIAEYDDLEVPSYALSYLVNDDSSGLGNDDDVAEIDKWYDWFISKCKDEQFIIFSVEEDEDGNSDSYFSNDPEFGLPCDVTKCKILIVESE